MPKSPEKQTEVLIAEDEESFIEALELNLTREGFVVRIARDGMEALESFKEQPSDIVLLDIMLPKMSGLDVCRQIRMFSGVPIIMLTAKSTEIDTVVGLEIGADDYVTKPFRIHELISRMRAVIRRSAQEKGETNSTQLIQTADAGTTYNRSMSEGVLQIGELVLDPDRHECIVRESEVMLPRKEFELLEQLMLHAGKVVTREVLIERIWGYDYVGDTKTLDVHVKRLRSRIEEDPANPHLIITIRGLGYKFELPKKTK
ncbi:MAG: response regulator transcription factor [Firmicutes bacterium]|nr:response regulator transcription factor [Bacillota bacterium]